MKKRSPDGLYWLLLGAVLIGVALRTIRFQELPPGLYQDQAYNGIDAVQTLAGDVRLFYEANFGREPLFIWLTAASVRIWGASPLAVRLPAWIVGVLTLLTAYGAARELAGRRIAVLTTAVLAVTLWHVHFSRLGFRAVQVPLFVSLAIGLGARGLRTGRRRWLVLSGIAAGALIYTYISARMAIIPAGLFLLYAWVRRRTLRLPTPPQWIAFALPALLTMAPFLFYTFDHWDAVLTRTQTVASVFNSDQPLTMLAINTAKALGMFVVRGDFFIRHNEPLRPVFDPALGTMACIGAGIALARFRKDPAAAFLLIWTAGMLLPSILTVDCPHFIRAIGVLPLAALFPALGLNWTWEKLKAGVGARRAGIGVALILLFGLSSTVRDYFFRYPARPETCDHFECPAVQMASEINTFLEAGWTEGQWFVPPGSPRTDRRVVIQESLWHDLIAPRYLIPAAARLDIPPDEPAGAPEPLPQFPTLFYGFNHKYYPEYWLAALHRWTPAPARLELSEGPRGVTVQDWDPHPVYLRFLAVPAAAPAAPQARLDRGFALVESCTQPDPQGLRVRLVWYADPRPDADYTVFIHYERGGQVIAQADGMPGLGYYPTSKWRAGDQFVDERRLSVSEVQPGDRLWVGMYFYPTGERLAVRRARGPVQDNRIAIEPSPCP